MSKAIESLNPADTALLRAALDPIFDDMMDDQRPGLLARGNHTGQQEMDTVVGLVDALAQNDVRDYVRPSVRLSIDPAMAEVGSTIASVALSWAVEGAAPTAQSLSWSGSGSVALTAADRTKALSGLSLSADTIFALAVTDHDAPPGLPNDDVATAKLTFAAKAYWGVSAVAAPTDAQLRAMAQSFATARGRTVTFDASGGRYPVFAWPAALGAVGVVRAGGVPFTDFTVTTRNVVNASGASIPMHILVFNTLLFGAAIEVSFA